MVHEAAAAFALDALDSGDAIEFERHLVTCPACDDELARLQATAAALAFAVELPVPSPKLRALVLDVGAPVIRLRRRRRPQLIGAGLAAAACAALLLGLHMRGDDGSARSMHRYAARGAAATLFVARDGEAVLVARRLATAPAGKAYEAWILDGGRATPSGVLRGGVLVLTRRVPRGATVAVSLEPAGGSPRPTGPLLLRAETT